jgi:hypothetical protein
MKKTDSADIVTPHVSDAMLGSWPSESLPACAEIGAASANPDRAGSLVPYADPSVTPLH